jgi:hypothetical protein
MQLEEAGAWRNRLFSTESTTRAIVPIRKFIFSPSKGSLGMDA